MLPSLWRRGPASRRRSLGLPEGSMRAFLALAFIVLVGVFGSFIFFETRSTGVLHSVKQLSLSDEGAIQVRQNLPSGLISGAYGSRECGSSTHSSLRDSVR